MKREIKEAWGLKVGDLVYDASAYVMQGNLKLGKILVLRDWSSKLTCDVYWFAEEEDCEKNIPLSQLKLVDSIEKMKAKYSTNEGNPPKK